MDTAMIATAVTGCLVPALPYLMKAGEKGAEVLGEKLGAGAWETAKSLWKLLRPVAEVHPAVTSAAQEVAEAPDDADAQAAFRHQLKKLLTADEALATALGQVVMADLSANYHAQVLGDGGVAQGPGAIAAGKGGVAAGNINGDVRIAGTEVIGTVLKKD